MQEQSEKDNKEKVKRGPKSNLVKSQEANAAKTELESRCRKSGEEACDTLVMLGYTFLGPEWNYLHPIKVDPNDPDSPVVDEKTHMRTAWGDMFVTYQWDVVPPWLSVLIVTLGYGAARLQMESVKARFKKGFFASLKERIFHKPVIEVVK